MNRRFASVLAPIALAIPLFLVTLLSAQPVSAVGNAGQDGATEAHALKVTQLKLAALVKEAQMESGPSEAATKKVADQKNPPPVRKKRHSKSRHRARARVEMHAKVQKIVGRRLTQAEVRGVLSTTRDFTGSDLSGLNLVGVDLSGVKFNRANLHLANMERADLAESDLELADLSGANLAGASLNQARLRGTQMAGTRMDGALWVDRTICKKGSVGNCIE